jgi:hypothetical protein
MRFDVTAAQLRATLIKFKFRERYACAPVLENEIDPEILQRSGCDAHGMRNFSRQKWMRLC